MNLRNALTAKDLKAVPEQIAREYLRVVNRNKEEPDIDYSVTIYELAVKYKNGAKNGEIAYLIYNDGNQFGGQQTIFVNKFGIVIPKADIDALKKP